MTQHPHHTGTMGMHAERNTKFPDPSNTQSIQSHRFGVPKIGCLHSHHTLLGAHNTGRNEVGYEHEGPGFFTTAMKNKHGWLIAATVF